jgi:hypothetical protein
LSSRRKINDLRVNCLWNPNPIETKCTDKSNQTRFRRVTGSELEVRYLEILRRSSGDTM